MDWHKKLNNFKEIPQLEYEGYIWVSDAKKPEIITSEAELSKYEKNGTPTNPFILEGHLYSRSQNISVSIRHTSGKYYITQFNIAELNEKENLVDKYYLAHRNLDKENQLHFQEIWLPESDKNCENMEVLTKKAVAFVGFEEGGKQS